ncbi:MAG TPA: hypothetical protein VHC49_27050, partial [Mycobacteriales bacterium]|nr:hypothetical protein [Mycobacteriales bacterium]
SHAGTINHGGNHLKTYAHALRHAQQTIKKLIADAKTAESNAKTHAQTVAHQHHTTATEDQLSSAGKDAVAPYLAKYHHEITTLKKAGRKCGAALENAVPGYKKGMSPSQIRVNAYNSMASTLPELAEQQGHKLAQQAVPYLNQSKHLPPWLLAQIEQFKQSPYFARGFLLQVGSKLLGSIPRGMSGSGSPFDDKQLNYNTRLLGDLGNMLALTTQDNSPARLPESYINHLLAPIEQKDPQRSAENLWGISQLLGVTNTRFGRSFLDRVGGDFYRVDKSGAGVPDIAPIVQMPGSMDHDTGLFHALSHNAWAAQDFFTADGRLKFYVADRPRQDYLDGGRALGSALQTATTTLRTGADGVTSAHIANNLINLIGSHEGKDNGWLADRDLGAIKPAIGNILVNYVHSVNTSIADNALGIGHLGVQESGNGPAQINFNVAYLKGTMRDIFNDQVYGADTYHKLATASLADSRATVLGDLDHASNFGAAQQHLRDNLQNAGHSLGAIFTARSKALADQGASQDAFNGTAQKVAGTFEGVVKDAVEIPGGPVTGIAVDNGLDKANEAIWPTDNKEHALDSQTALLDPTVSSDQQALDPKHVDAHLKKLYHQGHDKGTTPDEKHIWEGFHDGFKAEYPDVI